MILTNVRLIIAAVALVLGVGGSFYGGWKLRDMICDAAANKAQVDWLQRQVEANASAEKINQEMHDEHAAEVAKLEEVANALAGKISAGTCFTESDVRVLRNLWPPAK
jgi:uncharacterized protein HemX